MSGPPEPLGGGAIELLRVARRRRALFDAALAVSTAVVAATVVEWGLRPYSGVTARAVLASAAAAGSFMILWRRTRQHRTLAVLATVVERLRPQSRNVVITAEEIFRCPERATNRMSQVVQYRASRAIAGVRVSDLAPARTAAIAAVFAVAAIAASAFLPSVDRISTRTAAVVRNMVTGVNDDQQLRVTVTVQPPTYVRRDVKTLTNPARVDLLSGSRVAIAVGGSASHRVRFGQAPLGVISGSARTVDFLPRQNGYLAIESIDGLRRELIVVSVVPDSVPAVRVDQPARDLLLPDAHRSILLRIVAMDDYALASLQLRYTTMAGAGERFEFKEGSIPLRVERDTAREWQATGELSLERLNLSPGDSVIYRAVATDHRPGAEIATSDSYFVEISGPGQVPLDAVDMRPEEDRYAFSQQMIVLKIERLRARESALAAEQRLEEAALIAAEQRTVRGNFVFLLGGHVEDEEIEAEQSTEIAEGRLRNPARRDISLAIRDMTRAEQGLTGGHFDQALAAARSAVTALQRAFGRTRYLLRTLPTQSRIDPSRRHAGSLTAVSDWERSRPDASGRTNDGVLSLFDGVMALARAERPTSLDIERIAERAVSMAPSSAAWQDIATRLLRTRNVLHNPQETRRSLQEVLDLIRIEAEGGFLRRGPLANPTSDLRRAWEARRSR